MSQPHERLNETLAELQAQLEQVETLEPEVRERLVGAIDEIQAALERHEPQAASLPIEQEHHESIVGRLRDSVRHFEETHPNLAGAVGSVIDALGRMGI